MDKSYTLESSSMSYTVGFEGDVIYCELIRRLKSCRMDQVTKIVQKKTTMGLGDETSFRIYFMENGVEKKFPWIQVLITASEFKPFIEDLKRRLGSHVIWEDKRDEDIEVEQGLKVFDMQHLPLGYSGSGLSRGVQLWTYMLCFAIFIIPLFYYITILVKGGYRLYATNGGLEVRKLKSNHIPWQSIEQITFQMITVKNYDNYQTNRVCKVRLKQEGKRQISWVMRYDHAMPLMKELAERGVIDEEMVGQFV